MLLLIGTEVVQGAGHHVGAVVAAPRRTHRCEFGCDNPGLGIGEPTPPPLWFPARYRPAGLKYPASPLGAVQCGIVIFRQPTSDLGTDIVVVHEFSSFNRT